MGVLAGCTKAQLNNKSKLGTTAPQDTVSLTVVRPPIGVASGGTLITVKGAGFLPGSTVTIGGLDCKNVTFVDESTLTCTSPVHSVGDSAVVVISPLGAIAELPHAYTFIADAGPVPGRAITGGGGVSVGGTGGGKIFMQAAIGEPAQIQILHGAQINALSGVYGALWAP